mmetsp:Transcript_14005/g.16961  ORF Transcript_14005/g.16961 Transcript_14005/m.16961 type:complete len:316 (+) Transcript_14005:85-1032(+)|eukprot:CAMPEP_0197861386 /NCGR_PEP_ID=MMETSP1438-20131217/37422_1 /TAXON_ID=1461541 /ORGANISM="Pterosperma sp., Strain CCMP1384" /LENGTH=315 /DNA_ID=CAMNT_0043478547 /DNA_START=85 /DNA_END=1032 /DNA_ORIENTATION=-
MNFDPTGTRGMGFAPHHTQVMGARNSLLPVSIVHAAAEKPTDFTNFALGAGIQCAEAATLGMPFEVWKTRMGRFRNESTLEAFGNVYNKGGVGAFWAGTGPKMVESALKGAILMFSKEAINDACLGSGLSPTTSGILAGAGGGVCQVSIMGPCTFLVTGAVNSTTNESTMSRIQRTWAANGLKGFYPGGTAIAFRQATNWASRQGFTEFVRERAKMSLYGNNQAKLSKWEEAGCGVIGGTLACWNHPFEVARIEMQSRADAGQSKLNMVQVFQLVTKEQGVGGLFKGIVPRVGLGIWQTLFMVTGVKIIKDALGK